jgi:hypothetical protein
MFKYKEPRNLYQSFRDGLLADAIDKGLREIDPWHMMPPVHIGRQQTVTLIRKMADRLGRDFPKGFSYKKHKIRISDELAVFVETHREMGSTEEEARAAWAAMQSIL